MTNSLICPHGTLPENHCGQCVAEGIEHPLPEKCCARCLNWNPNQGESMAPHAGSHCWKLGEQTADRFSCEYFCGADSVEANVPSHCDNGIMKDPNPNPVDGPTHILICTFATPKMRVSGNVVSDLDWLRYALRSIQKHCKGFTGVTIAHPAHETAMFAPLVAQFGVRLFPWPETPGNGFIDHQIQMAHADSIVPAGTKYVLHSDADCIFKMPTTVEDYFWEDRPYHIIRSWEDLGAGDPHRAGAKAVSDCLQWRTPTDYQLGCTTPIYGMCMNTGVFPIDFYKRYRDHVEAVHRKPFNQFMLEGRGEHPATRMDWTAMVGYAYIAMRDRFTWFSVESNVYPVDRKLAFWSHQGVTPEYAAKMEELINA